MSTDDLRSVLSRFGYSQDALGKKLGVKQTTVSAWVRNGRVPNWHVAKLLALAEERGVEIGVEEVIGLGRDSAQSQRGAA